MTKSLAMVFTYHTMAELLVVTSIAELQSMIVTQTFITANIVLLLFEKDVKCSSVIGFRAEKNPYKNERDFKPILNQSYYHGYSSRTHSTTGVLALKQKYCKDNTSNASVFFQSV